MLICEIYIVFNAGRRLCLGKVMAQIEIKNTIVALTRRHIRFELVDAEPLVHYHVLNAFFFFSHTNSM